MSEAPDLLQIDPDEGITRRGEISRALTFAYTTGGAQTAFDRIPDASVGADGAWQRAAFADQLFVAQLVEKCMPLPSDVPRALARPGRVGSLTALLCQPPRKHEG